MSLSTFLSILAASGGFIASAFFAIGAITMSSAKIFKISSSYYDANRHWGDSIAEQRADYIVGGLLLLLSFSLQLSAILVPPTFQPSLLQPFGFAVAGIFVSIISLLLFALWFRAAFSKSTKTKVRAMQDLEVAKSRKEVKNSS